ncbi:MAG: flagellar hook-basal body complex protein [Pseudomonadota bacterium]
MENTIYPGMARQMVLSREMGLIANNMANLNTPAFKLNALLQTETVRTPESPRLQNAAPLSMVADMAVVRDTAQGSLRQTGNNLDIALQGEGYLVVGSNGGPRYTRNGHLALSADRQLVDINGLPVLDRDNQPIAIPDNAGDLAIAKDGTISGDAGQIAQIRVVQFTDEHGVVPLGGGLHVSNDLPEDATDTQILQGQLEESNVKAILEMTRLIDVTRSYTSIASFLKDEQERQRSAIQRLSGTQSS